MRVHGHLLAHDVANLLIENHYQNLPHLPMREGGARKAAANVRRGGFARWAARRLSVDNFSRCSA